MTSPSVPQDLVIPTGGIELRATLRIPRDPTGLVVFAHGSGSSRTSPRNRHVADALHARGLATLLLDLLTPDEAEREALDLTLRDDVFVLAARLVGVTDWIRGRAELRGLPLAYFGSSTGAAAALIAAARRPEAVAAIVSRGGRPDLAADELAAVRAPTLFVVGGADTRVLELNRAAAACLIAPWRLDVVLGAGHLFEEPGALDQVAQLAGDWLVLHLRAGRARRGTAPAPTRRPIQFEDRRAAGRALAGALLDHAGTGALIVGLPRGGVIVADEVAQALAAPLDVWIVRKLGVPHRPELGMGALAESATLVLDRELVRALEVPAAALLEVVHREAAEVRRRIARYRGDRAAPDVRGRTVIVVDDGIATGGTMRAAVRAIRRRGAARVVVAIPVAAPEAIASLRDEADDIVCLSMPLPLVAIGAWYQDFRPVPDAEVVRILAAASTRPQLEAVVAAHGDRPS